MKTNFKLAAWLAAAVLLSACSKQVASALAQEPGSDTACSLDGMVLSDFPGPKAQIVYAEGKPDFFCDVMELFAALREPQQKRGAAALFVQDMGETSWETPSGHWIDARTALFVVGSKKAGSMGPTFGTFSSMDAAQAFVQAEGGKIVRFDQVTPAMLTMDSAAGHDNAMGH